MQYVKTDELYHHGILGQKWGVRNGPPYPLSADRHSASERKAGYKKSISGGVRKNSKQKEDHGDTQYSVKSKFSHADSSGFASKKKAESLEEDCAAVNPHYKKFALNANYSMNCTNCVMAYALRRMGLDVEAQPLATGRRLEDITNYFKDCYDDKFCDAVHFNSKVDTALTVRNGVVEQCNKLCGKDAGVGFLAIRGPYMAHVFSWEKTANGKVVFLDPQSNHVDDSAIERYFTMVSKGKQLDSSVLVTRLDGCNVNEKRLKEVCKNH